MVNVSLSRRRYPVSHDIHLARKLADLILLLLRLLFGSENA